MAIHVSLVEIRATFLSPGTEISAMSDSIRKASNAMGSIVRVALGVDGGLEMAELLRSNIK
jgi:hypothetical protein